MHAAARATAGPLPPNGASPANSAPQTDVPTRRLAVEARGLSRSFDSGKGAVQALGNVDFQIERGQFVAIVGPSGCGKSTLLRIAAGLTAPSTGEMTVTSFVDSQRLLAMVFQTYGIYPWKTVEANVRFGLELAGADKRDIRADSQRWLERLGLKDFAKAYPATLSGGMLQRVAIARALASDPEILLMDEPFAALDAQLRTILQDELLRLWEEDRRTVLFVTHSIEEALVLADRVLVMSARPGRILADHPVPFDRPRSAHLRANPKFGELREEIWSVVRTEVDRSLATTEEPGDRNDD